MCEFPSSFTYDYSDERFAFQPSSRSSCTRGLFYCVGHGCCGGDSPMVVCEFNDLDGDGWGGSHWGLAIIRGSGNT